MGQDNTTFMAADVILDGFELDGIFSEVDGTPVIESTSFQINSIDTEIAPSGQVDVNIVIDENGWNVTAAPNSGGSTNAPVTGLSIASGATDLASIVFFNSANALVAPQNKGFWVDNIVVATDQTVDVPDFDIGDVNRDGQINFLDISPFIAVLSSGGYQYEADIDQNNAVNFLDISPFIALLAN